MKNKRTHLRTGLLAALVTCLFSSYAGTGDIMGIVYDENGDVFPIPVIELYAGEERIKGVIPDGNGKYVFKPVEAGDYILKAKYAGYQTLVAYVSVSADKTTYQDFRMKVKTNELPDVWILPKNESMVQKTMSSGMQIDYGTIKDMPVVAGDIVALTTGVTPGIIPTPDGKDMYIRGSRRGTTAYFIDDQRVIGSFDVPSLSLQGITVYTGGIPAMYGDVTGGIVVVSTKSYTQGIVQKKQMVETIKANKEKENQQEELIIKKKGN